MNAVAPRASLPLPDTDANFGADANEVDIQESRLLDQLLVHAAVLTPQGVFVDVNRALLDATGLTRDAVIGRPFWTMPCWSHDAAVRELIKEAVAGAAIGRRSRFDVRARVPGGSLASLDLQIAPLYDATGEVVFVAASAIDLTEHERATAGLLERQARAGHRLAELEAIYQRAPIGLAVLDADMRLVRLNEHFAAISGLPVDADVGQLASDLPPAVRDQIVPRVRGVLATGMPMVGVEITGQPTAGAGPERRWIEHFYPLYGENGTTEAVGIICEELEEPGAADLDLGAYRRHIEHQALHDPLTALPNRALLADRAQQAVTVAKRSGRRVALMMLDLDDFKSVNDSLGHAAGDTLLQEVASRLAVALRGSDTVGRLGGDEFAVVTGALDDITAAAAVAERVLAALEPALTIMGRPHQVRASIGIAIYPDDARRLGGLFRSADLALYQAKGQGGGRAVFFEENMRDELRARQQLEWSLKRAVDEQDFRLELRPRHALTNGRLIAIDVQPLWRHPTLGLAPVERHLLFAERKGLASPIALWLVHRLAALFRDLGTGARGVRLCVAFSPNQLADIDVIRAVVEMLDEVACEGDRLQVEVLTGATWSLQDVPIDDALMALAARGVAIALRGFGADHVAFHDLRRLPLDSLVLEADLVRELGGSPEADAFVDALASLGRRLGKRVIAMGVETAVQVDLLRAAGCEEGEGPYFAGGRVGEELPRARPGR